MAQTIVLEEQEDRFDVDTGEITSSKRRTVKKSPIEATDEFVKVSRYLHTIFAYHGIPLRLVGISLCIAERMDFKTNVVYLLQDDKIEIGEMLGLAQRKKKNGRPDTNTVDRLIMECKKFDIIRPTGSRGKYAVNGYLFSTGSTSDTRKIQALFDFENDTVTAVGEMTNRITGQTVRKAISNRPIKQIEGQMSIADLGIKGV